MTGGGLGPIAEGSIDLSTGSSSASRRLTRMSRTSLGGWKCPTTDGDVRGIPAAKAMAGHNRGDECGHEGETDVKSSAQSRDNRGELICKRRGTVDMRLCRKRHPPTWVADRRRSCLRDGPLCLFSFPFPLCASPRGRQTLTRQYGFNPPLFLPWSTRPCFHCFFFIDIVPLGSISRSPRCHTSSILPLRHGVTYSSTKETADDW